MHQFFQKQLDRCRTTTGEVDIEKLADLVNAAYQEFELNRTRTERSMALMVEELDELNSGLENQVEARTAELRANREELRRQNALFETALEHMSNGLCVFTADLRLVVCNQRYLEMYGLPLELGLPGTRLADIVTYRSQARIFESTDPGEVLQNHIQHGNERRKCDIVSRLTDGRVYAISFQPIPSGGWVTTHDDITKLNNVESELTHLAYHDSLTGLPNRSFFYQRLEEALDQNRTSKAFSILCIDLDGFKSVNDTLGHASGDELLKMVAQRLRSCVRKNDTIARMGGDEFSILLRSISEKDAPMVAERILGDLKKPFNIDGQEVMIDSSIGIALSPRDGDTPEALLRRADLALYEVKYSGRGAFRFFESEMDLRMQDRRQKETDLRLAVDREEFELYYQPILNIASQKTSVVEVLLRWNHPTRGIVSPGEFITIAEDMGLIVQLGEWIIGEAFATAAQWPDDISIAVNVSSVQLKRADMASVVLESLVKTGLKASRVEIEITESAFMGNDEQILETLHKLKDMGVRIALDDFGSGYSALSYLLNFPFDKIKIDGAFVRGLNMGNGHGAKEILSAMAYLGQQLGMRTTAECVETEDDLRHVQLTGYTEAQGYYICRPLPAADVERFLGLIPHVETLSLGKTA